MYPVGNDYKPLVSVLGKENKQYNHFELSHFLSLMSLAKCLSTVFFFSKNQLLVLLIFSIVVFCLIYFIYFYSHLFTVFVLSSVLSDISIATQLSFYCHLRGIPFSILFLAVCVCL